MPDSERLEIHEQRLPIPDRQGAAVGTACPPQESRAAGSSGRDDLVRRGVAAQRCVLTKISAGKARDGAIYKRDGGSMGEWHLQMQKLGSKREAVNAQIARNNG